MANDVPIDVISKQLPAEQVAHTETVQQSHTLADLAREYELFTPALLMTHGRFDRDPVQEYNRAWPAAVPELLPWLIVSCSPFFTGLGQSVIDNQIMDWNHCLYAIERSRWDDCRDFIAAICAYHVPTHHYMKVGYYKLSVVDHFVEPAQAVRGFPSVDITVFGVLTNSGRAMILPGRNTGQLPFLYVAPPDPSTVLEADAVLGPPPDHAHFAFLQQMKQQ